MEDVYAVEDALGVPRLDQRQQLTPKNQEAGLLILAALGTEPDNAARQVHIAPFK